MKIRKRHIIFFICLLLSGHRAYSEEALTWGECVKEAKGHHPDLTSAL